MPVTGGAHPHRGGGARRSAAPLCATRVSGQRRASVVQGVGRDLLGGLLKPGQVFATLEGFAVKLVASSVSDGRAANHADSLVTMRASMGASLRPRKRPPVSPRLPS